MNQTYQSGIPPLYPSSAFDSLHPSFSLPSLNLSTNNVELTNLLMLLNLRNTLQTQIVEARLGNFIKMKGSAPLQYIPSQLKKLSDSYSDFYPKQSSLPTFQNVRDSPSKSLHSQTSLSISSRLSSYNSLSAYSGSPAGELEESQKFNNSNGLHQGTNSFLPDDPNICLEAQIKHIVMFFIKEYGKQDEERIKQERARYVNFKPLLEVFDALVAKYSSTTKTREEMVKYILRRAFKFFRRSIKKAAKLDSKTVSTKLCKRYFNSSTEEVQKEEAKEDEDLLKLLLPFRKNSKNKTMNSAFICEVFGNEEFREDYKNYLQEFKELAEKDNKEKINRFTSFLEECIKKESYEEIKAYKRIPWLQVWNDKTRKVAHEILGKTTPKDSSKKTKVEAE